MSLVNLGRVDREAEKFHLATTGGVISSPGIAGLTLEAVSVG